MLCNKDGEDVCQAVALQYIMSYHNIPLKNALNYVENIEGRETIHLSKRIFQSLEVWEAELTKRWSRDKLRFTKRITPTVHDDEKSRVSRSSRGSYSSLSLCFSQTREIDI